MELIFNKIVILVDLLHRGYFKYKYQIIILVILGFLGGILEGIGIAAIIPLFSLATGTIPAETNTISNIIRGIFSFFHLTFNLKFLIAFICLLFILRALCIIFCNYIQIKISANYEERTRTDLLDKTLKANWGFLLSQKIGHLETLLMTNVFYSRLLLQYISLALMNISSLIMYAVVAMTISTFTTLIAFALGFSIFIIFRPSMYKIKSMASERNNINKSLAHYVNENVLGMKTVKSMFVGENISLLGREYFRKMTDLLTRSSFLKIVSEASMLPIGVIFVCVIFAINYKLPNFSFAAFAAIIYLVQRIFVYMQLFQTNMQSMIEMAPYLKSIIEYEEKVMANRESDSGFKPFIFENNLEFRNVIFSYNNHKKIINKVNFFVNKGEMIGLIGPSGAGKTTLVDLILRLFNPISGEILLDNINSKEINLGDWRNNIGYVSQDVFLINDTIANNIRFYNKNLSDKEIIESAKMAHIYDFIMSCPNGFNTVIGERGIMLSAGQRQRIIIARVLARKPQLLILDEATSALDNESENQIQAVIEGLKNKITVLAIAHRLSTIINSDKLLVIENGQIIETGAPRNLLKDKDSYFYKVYNIKK